MAKEGQSAQKALRQSLRRRVANRWRLRTARTAVRAAREAIAAGGEAGAGAVREAVIVLDRAASRGTIHPNNAARRKSRLMRRLNKTGGP